MLNIIAYKFDPNSRSGEAGTLHHLTDQLSNLDVPFRIITRNYKQGSSQSSYEILNLDLKEGPTKKIPFLGLYLYYYRWYSMVFDRLRKEVAGEIVWVFNFHSPRMLIPNPKFDHMIFGPLGENDHLLMVSDTGRPALIRAAYLIRHTLLYPFKKRYLKSINKRKFSWVLTDSDDILTSQQDFSNVQCFRQRQQPEYLKISSARTRREAPANGDLKVIYVGRNDPIKRGDLCAPIITRTASSGVKVNVTVVGHHIKLNVKDTPITYHKSLSHDSLLELFNTQDVLLFPSLESGGMVVDEALSNDCIPLFSAARLVNKKFASELIAKDLACGSTQSSEFIEWASRKLIEFNSNAHIREIFLSEMKHLYSKNCNSYGYQALIDELGYENV